MAQFLGFGDGSDGVLTVSTTTTDSPIDSSCSGTSGSTSLTATNASFAAGQKILIHQSRGTGAGNWEVNQISSYSTGTITTVHPLANTYADSGASQAQVLVLKEYTGVNVSSTLTAKAWDGDVGGILAFMCSGKVDVSGTITASEKGYRGGAKAGGDPVNAYQGESAIGAGTNTTSANGSGGGGGKKTYGDSSPGGGGGGGHATSGSNGTDPSGSDYGYGGTTDGGATLTDMVFGAGGGGGAFKLGQGNTEDGGDGGGIVAIFAGDIEVTGSISANGQTPANATGPAEASGAGGGAGGSVFIKAKSATLGTSLVTATKGNGATTPVSGGNGGNGGSGRVRIETCSLSGTTNPSASSNTGGYDYCGQVAYQF